jgi:hypothetical protein
MEDAGHPLKISRGGQLFADAISGVFLARLGDPMVSVAEIGAFVPRIGRERGRS